MKILCRIIALLFFINIGLAEPVVDQKTRANLELLNGDEPTKIDTLKTLNKEIQKIGSEHAKSRRVDLMLSATGELVEPYRDTLIRLSEDKSQGVRAYTALLFGYAKSSPRVIDSLNKLAVDENKEVRSMAFQSIELLNTPDYATKKVVMESFDAGFENPNLLKGLIRIAVIWDMQEAAEPLNKALKNDKESVRGYATAGLLHLYKDQPGKLAELSQLPYDKIFDKQLNELATNLSLLEEARSKNRGLKKDAEVVTENATTNEVKGKSQVTVPAEKTEKAPPESTRFDLLGYALLAVAAIAFIIYLIRRRAKK